MPLTNLPHKMERTIAWCVALLALLAGAAGVHAQITPAGPEFQVNTYTTGAESFAAGGVDGLAVDPIGRFVITWHGATDGDGSGIFAQRFASSGTSTGSEFQINAVTTGAQSNAGIAMDSSGDFVVTWESPTSDGDGSGIFARLFASNGTPSGSDFQVNTTTVGSQKAPRISRLTGGVFVIAWRGPDGSSDGVFAQRFLPGGGFFGSEFQVNTYITGDVGTHAVATHPDGGFVVAWNGQSDGSSAGIFARKYDVSGTPTTSAFQVNTYTTAYQFQPSLSVDTIGNFVVAWTSFTGDGDSDTVFARRFNAGGVGLGSELIVNSITLGPQRSANVATETDGDFIVAWDNPHDGYSYGVFVRRFTSAGAAQGTELQVNEFTASNQRWSSIRTRPSDTGFVVAWNSYTQDGSNEGVFGRLIADATATPTTTPTGTPPPPTPTPTETVTPTITETPTLTPTSSVAFCGTSPASMCTTTSKSGLKIKNTGDPVRSQILWKWLTGTATMMEIGDPTVSTSYALCLYANGSRIAEVQIESGSAWTAAGSTGFKYKSPLTNADGAFKALAKSGTGKAKLLVKARGVNLTPPTLPLSNPPSVVAQLVKNPGAGSECWESTFTSPYTKDDDQQFKDKEP